MNRIKLTDKQKARIVTMYADDGFTGQELAAKFGVSVSTIFNILRDNDVTIRPRGPQPANA